LVHWDDGFERRIVCVQGANLAAAPLSPMICFVSTNGSYRFTETCGRLTGTTYTVLTD
jgi:hypothetical protein